MIEEVAIVREVHSKNILVETKVKTTCGQCAVKDSCATSTIAKAFSDKSSVFAIETDELLDIGDVVKVGIPEQNLLSAAFHVYLLPIFSLFAGAFFISLLLPSVSELFQLAFGVFAAALTYKWLKHKYSQTNTKNQITPVFIEKIGHDTNNPGSNTLSIKRG